MTEHDYFIFNLERKQARVRKAIKEYKQRYFPTVEEPPIVRRKPTRGDNLKTKLLGSK